MNQTSNECIIIELFAGIGSPRMAARELNIPHRSIVSEIDPHAYRSYCAIHGETPNLGDITKVETLPECDVLTYGFPCQDISIAGVQRGLEEGSGTRSSLVHEIKRLFGTMEKLPHVLIMENVKALTYKKFKAQFQAWIDYLTGLGYTSTWQIMNAAYYGVPQKRERVFLVSILGTTKFKFPSAKLTDLRLKDILEDEVDESYFLSAEQIAKYEDHRQRQIGQGRGHVLRRCRTPSKASTLTTIPTRNSQTFLIMAGDLNYTRYESSNRVYDPNGCSPTCTCRGDQDRGIKIILDRTGQDRTGQDRTGQPLDGVPPRIRILTPLECWRAMGFPDWSYHRAAEVCTKPQLYKQAGNSIVVGCMKSILYELLTMGEIG